MQSPTLSAPIVRPVSMFHLIEPHAQVVRQSFWNSTKLVAATPLAPDESWFEQNAAMELLTGLMHVEWVFGGGLRSMWRALSGFYPFTTWGSIDVWFLNARAHHAIPTITELDEETICVHQNHDDSSTPTPRDMDTCLAALKDVPLTANELW